MSEPDWIQMAEEGPMTDTDLAVERARTAVTEAAESHKRLQNTMSDVLKTLADLKRLTAQYIGLRDE